MDKPRIALIFDFDGTLWNSMSRYAALAADCMNRHLRIPKAKAASMYLTGVGIPFRVQLRGMFPDGDAQAIEDCAREFDSRKVKEVYGRSAPFPDAEGCSKALEKVGVLTAISSATESGVIRSCISGYPFFKIFGNVYGSDHGTKAGHIRDVRRGFGPGLILYIGDSFNDMSLNSEKSVLTVGRYGKKADCLRTREELLAAGADYVIADLRDIIQIMKEAAGKSR